jgi:glutamate racemase
MSRLAIIDWGIGGFGFWKEWQKLRPNEGAVYFSDSGYTPYGKVPDDELVARLQKVIARLRDEHKITHCLIACHSASTVTSRLICEGVTISGIIEGTVDFIRATIPPGLLGLAGGRRTIESQTYHQLIPNYQVRGLIAQPLSAAVEAGQLHGQKVEALVSDILKPSPPDLVLACTHYPALTPVIQAVFPDLGIHDPVPAIARSLHQKWPAMEGGPVFKTSGSPDKMRTGAQKAFGIEFHK